MDEEYELRQAAFQHLRAHVRGGSVGTGNAQVIDVVDAVQIYFEFNGRMYICDIYPSNLYPFETCDALIEVFYPHLKENKPAA